jgi:hypothetical protein
MNNSTQPIVVAPEVDSIVNAVVHADVNVEVNADVPINNRVNEMRNRMLLTKTVLDICGLDEGDHGRVCINHGKCGHFDQLKDVLYCKNELQNFNGQICDVVKVFKVNTLTGQASCHVGYVPERYFFLSSRAVFDGLYLVVDLDYRLDDLKK